MKTLVLMLSASVFSISALSACAVDAGDDGDQPAAEQTAEQQIIGGVTDGGDPCVVAVFAHAPGASSGSLCTGTVIGPHTVLTAAHCVSPAIIGAGQQLDILNGTTLTGFVATASSSTWDMAWNPSNLFGGHDIGIVHTSGALPLPSCPIGATNLAAAITIVGYGSNTHTNAGVGTKRTVTTVIDAYNSLLLQIGNSSMQTCHGDSGGPAFQGGAVVAVTSFGSDPSASDVCEGGGFSTRTDAEASFINANNF